MTDRIGIHGLRVHGRHGVFDHERRTGQEFVVDVVLEVDTRRAGRTDDLADTVDYGSLADELAAVAGGEPVALLETLAARLADVCLARPGVLGVEVTVHKPDAPVPARLDDITVTIRRDRG